MKKIIFLALIFMNIESYAQVGIGTTDPQESLHVAGTTSTIRIEGLDVINNTLNQGPGKLTPVFVDNKGNFTLVKPSYTSGGTGYNLPLNFLQYTPNFIPNNPAGHAAPYDGYGTIVNNDASTTTTEELIHKVEIDVPTSSMVEIKYAISLYFSSTNLFFPPATEPNDKKTRVIQSYFLVDFNSDGLSGAELTTKYGFKGQYYASDAGGTKGYPYMNSQGYVNMIPGHHTVYFYGIVNDPPNTFTSIGFGGANEYLKIRLFN